MVPFKKLNMFSSKAISILGVGFGTGLNAYMSYLEGQKLKLSINYVAIEAYPISIKQAQQLNYANLLSDTSTPNILQEMHRIEWEEIHQLTRSFKFQKCKTLLELLDFESRFDIIYFDAFAPEIQADLWTNDIMKKMYKALKPKGVWVSYCAKGIVKRALKSEGFQINSIPGPPGKREMTRAIKL